jgi:hypothetical protein
MTTATNYTPATDAVRSYQALNSQIAGRMKATTDPHAARFWMALLNDRTHEIAETYGISVDELLDAWFAWVEVIKAERARRIASRREGVGA